MSNNQFKLIPVDYSKPYDEQPECKRHVIGAYANLARHNMTVTINVIMQAIGMPLFNENDIDDAFNKNHRKKLAQLDNIQKVNLQKRLYRHFPFFKRMKLEDENKKSVQLNTLLEVMSDFTNCMAMIRNFYTHYHPYNSPAELANQLELRKQMGKRLQSLYENTSQMFKANEKLDHAGNEVFAALRVRDNKGNVKRFVRNPDYPAYMIDKKNGMSDIAIIYFLCLFLEKKVSFELMDEVGLAKQIKFKGEDADRQLLFVKEILCMNRIRMTKTKFDSEMTDTALALDMINELRKCPKPLYEVFCKEARDEFKDDSTVLWEKEHGKETVETEDNGDDDVEDTTIEKDTPRSTFVRWEDRFPQMALRYIDYQGLFKDIRFQLNLGKYRFAFYRHDKAYSVDNEERLRILQKELHGFGRIQEVEGKKNEKWAVLFEKKYVEDGLTKKKPDEAGKAPYVTEQYAQYAVDEKSHSIGLRWEGWQPTGDPQKHYGDLENQKMFIPYLPTKPLPEEKQTNQGEPLLPPQAMLSLYELPGLLFYQYLLKKNNKNVLQAEEIIKEYYRGLKTFFKDVADEVLKPSYKTAVDVEEDGKKWQKRKEELGELLCEKYSLKPSDIPKKLLDYLCVKLSDTDKKLYDSALNRLQEKKAKIVNLQKSFKEKKSRIGSKENKFNKMRASIKTGALAQWLIRDIMDWIPEDSDVRGNITGQTYTVIQSNMALFGQVFEGENGVCQISLSDLHNSMVKAGIIAGYGEDHSALRHHPFLYLVFRDYTGGSIEGFYEMYLQKEEKYIENTINFIVGAGADQLGKRYRFIPFLHSKRSRWHHKDDVAIKKLAARYLECPLQLPNGMFAKPIFDLLEETEPKLKEVLKKAKEVAVENRLDNNTAYLINLYFENVEGDHAQHYYSTEPIEGSPSPYRHIYRVFKKYFGEPKPGTNQKTTPKYTIEEIREILKDKNNLNILISHYIATDVRTFREKRFSIITHFNFKKFTDLQWKIVKEENASGKVRRNYQQRQDEVNRRIEEKKGELKNQKQKIEKEIKEYEASLIKKQKRQFKKVIDNERTIRRYKTQDILLLIMAREILKAKSQHKDFTKDFCLKYVMTDSLLDKPIDFEWKVCFKDKDNKTQSKAIEQKGMKMKNYGQFYKFASDHQRLESLLSRLPQDKFSRAEIENEFSYYDTNRSEVFRLVYIIESEAYKLKPELENDANANEEWFCYIDKKGKKHPVRNNFLSLLEILAAGKDGILDDKEKKSLQSTRNAFGHNTYEVDLPAVFEGKEGKMKIPEVANGITDKIEEQTVELKKNLKK